MTMLGKKHSEFAKRKISLSNKGKRSGVKASIETRQKMSDSRKGKKRSPEAIANCILGYKRKVAAGYTHRGGMLGKHHTKESKLKSSHSNMGKKRSEETKRKLSMVMKGSIPWNKGKTGVYSAQHLQQMSDVRKGKPSKNKGRHSSEETRKKVGLASRGRKCSFETRQKMSQRMRGNKNGLGHKQNEEWRIKHSLALTGDSSFTGFRTPENRRVRGSVEYKRWRLSVFIRDNFTCQGCKRVGGYLEVHHIQKFSKRPDLRFDENNGVTLCLDCHMQVDGHRGKFRPVKLKVVK